jgi:signal peptidase I
MVRLLRILKLVLMATWFLATVSLVGLIVLSNAISYLDRDMFLARGTSMEPAVPAGSAVIVRHLDPTTVRTGDVISFRRPDGAVVTHRVVSLTVADGGLAFETRGDADQFSDPAPVPASAVIGVSELVVPFAGSLMGLLGTTFGAVAALGLLGALLGAVWFTEEAIDIARRSAERTRVLELAH